MSEDSRVDIEVIINRIAGEVNSTLNDSKKEKYFEDIVLLYSLVENLVKWITLMKILWNKSQHKLLDGEAQTIRKFAVGSYYATVLKLAYAIELIDYPLFQMLIRLKGKRDNTIHQFWLYSHQKDANDLRKELEELAEATNSLIGIFNKLSEEIGVDEIYDFILGSL